MPDTSNPWLLPGLILILGILLGWVADRVVRVGLERWARSTPWKGDEVILNAMRGLTWLWFSLIGLHVAAGLAPLPPHVANLLGRLVEVGFIISLTVGLARVATNAFAIYSEHLAFKGSATVVTLLIKVVLFTVGALVILQTEGISITPVLTALGVGGLAVALALQDTLGNIFAGIHTLMAGQIRPGDFIRLDSDNEGWVIDIGWRNTSIRTMANNLIVVPNKKLGESIVTNISRPESHMSLPIAVGVAYESDLEQVERVLLELGNELAAEHTGVLADPAPVVRFAAFADSSIEVRLVLRVDTIDSFYLMRHHAIKAVHARLRREGITIAYPTRTVYLQSPAPAPVPGAQPRV
jgi:small-conductance mechanosensitive channel